jgi:glycogen debranching enzyme
MYKVIEDINLIRGGKVKEIVNEFSSVIRKRAGANESFFMPYGYESLVYELDKPGEVEVVLDVRRSYDNPEIGRSYKISRSKSGIVIGYKDDNTKMYLVIKADNPDFEKIERWIKREYLYDKARGTVPYEKYVYRALRLKAGRIVFAFSKSLKRAADEADYVFKNLKRLKEHQKIYVNKINTKKAKESCVKIAKKCAINSLNSLAVNFKNKRGVYAGLPWFFQFWSRDELVSLKALMLNKQNKEVKDILVKNLNLVKNGKLANMTLPLGSSGNADSIGWLFKRAGDCWEVFSAKERLLAKKKLADSIKAINKSYMKNGLVYNEAKETWMDTEWGGDNRAGYRIEIQALFLNMLKLAYGFTKNKKYMQQEEEMKKKVREKFWNGRILADGLNDFTSRPNVFIAAYVYPELLSKKEWEICFENAIKKLWLNWGGFSSIGKDHYLFCRDYTGESPRSYHRGDSWFWVNNLAALMLLRINKRKFKKYIDKIIEAGVKEILTMGAIGHHAELSSASSLKSEGCSAQAWSNAMFIELVEEI